MSSISSASSSTSDVERVELQRPAAEVIERAARRGDDDVGAAAQARESAGPSARRRRAARRRSDVPLARTCAWPRRPASPARASAPARGRAAPRRSSASRCASRSISGSANAAVLPVPVPAWPIRSRPVEQQRNRFALDGRGLFVAEGRHGLDEGIGEAEAIESNGSGMGGTVTSIDLTRDDGVARCWRRSVHPPRRNPRPAFQGRCCPLGRAIGVAGGASVRDLELVGHPGRDELKGVAPDVHIGDRLLDFGIWQFTHSLPALPRAWCVWSSIVAACGPFGELGPWQVVQSCRIGLTQVRVVAGAVDVVTTEEVTPFVAMAAKQ